MSAFVSPFHVAHLSHTRIQVRRKPKSRCQGAPSERGREDQEGHGGTGEETALPRDHREECQRPPASCIQEWRQMRHVLAMTCRAHMNDMLSVSPAMICRLARRGSHIKRDPGLGSTEWLTTPNMKRKTFRPVVPYSHVDSSHVLKTSATSPGCATDSNRIRMLVLLQGYETICNIMK